VLNLFSSCYLQSIQKTRDDLKSSKEELQSVQKSVQEDQATRATIDKELETINHTLRDARDDKRKNDHEARLEDAISSLKRYFPGVKGRLVKLCQPTMKRYDLAVTVAGGKDMVSLFSMTLLLLIGGMKAHVYHFTLNFSGRCCR